MATRSIVAAHTEKGVRGVYVHWDGYPEGRVPVLKHLIARDGVGKVVATILGQPHGWSHLDPEIVESQAPGINGADRFLTIPGYGVQYLPYPIQGNENYWTPTDGSDWMGIEYVYLITESGEVEYESAFDSAAVSAMFRVNA